LSHWQQHHWQQQVLLVRQRAQRALQHVQHQPTAACPAALLSLRELLLLQWRLSSSQALLLREQQRRLRRGRQQ
jgi:hypothetical protein